MDLEEIKRRMHSGGLYFPEDEALAAEQQKCLSKLFEYNATRPEDAEKRRELLKEMFFKIGEGCYIEPPFHANFGGKHVLFGDRVYANFNLTLVDDTYITVGDDVMFGPSVTVCTATHPVDPGLRLKKAQYNLPVKIGKNAWIGGGSFIMPGVTVGENSVIGAGSLVTKDIPAGAVAFGSPAVVVREITERDAEFYRKGMKTDL